MYYADYAKEPAKALDVAQREYARRHDVFTLDCYAWALHVNGQDTAPKNRWRVRWQWEFRTQRCSATPARLR